MQTLAPRMPQTFRTHADAYALAAKLQADDPEWSYVVEAFPNGLAVVVCYDEDGKLLHRGM